MTDRLRDYQRYCVDAARQAFTEHDNVLVVIPTGGGKTFVTAEIASGGLSEGIKQWIVVHRLNLVKQIAKSLNKFDCVYGRDYGIVSSKHPLQSECPIQVCMAQTLVHRLDVLETPDMCQYDEAHHMLANTWTTIRSAAPAAAHFGLTATPIRGDGRGLGDVFDHLIVGPTQRQLIERGVLVPTRYLAPDTSVDLSRCRVSKRTKDYNEQDVAAAVAASTVVGDAVEHYLQVCPGVPTAAFYPSVKLAKEAAEKFNAGGVPAAAISGEDSDERRDSLFYQLEVGAIKVLCSCELISEGMDIPAVGCVILCRPTKSEVMWRQQIGRGVRGADGKEVCYVLDHVGNIHEFDMLPDADREWSLAETKPKKKRDSERLDPMRRCENCHCIFEPPATICPECGAEYKVKERTYKQVEGQLVLFDDAKMLKKLESSEKKKRVSEKLGAAKSKRDFLKIAEEEGYEPGWAIWNWRRRERRMNASKHKLGGL